MSKKDVTTDRNEDLQWGKQDRQKVREILTALCSAKTHINQDKLDPFVWGSARVNADLALAAHGELEGWLNTGDDLQDNPGSSFSELINSAMFLRLRDAFIEEAETGSRMSFARAVWRAYNAGLMSPIRITAPASDGTVPQTRS
jgi:hypothetical protein